MAKDSTPALSVTIGQHSRAGRKPENQDFHGALVPSSPARELKGVAIALADGISSSAVSHIAAQAAVTGFLDDYFCTSDAWSVKTAAQRVISATNSWLHSQTRHSRAAYDPDRGYVCTFSGMVVKARTAHLFHVGDARIYRLEGAGAEQLTTDHRMVVSSAESYLGRALGAAEHVEIDYRRLQVNPGDVFVLATDGVHEHLDSSAYGEAIAGAGGNLDAAAQKIVDRAFDAGSTDNLTVQILRIDTLAEEGEADFVGLADDLPAPPILEPRQIFEGYRILRTLRATSRSHIYLAEEQASGRQVVVKIPSLDLREDRAYRRQFMMEEWIGRRIASAHVLKMLAPAGPRRFLFLVSEYVEGETLAQWMRDNPRPGLAAVRALIAQITKGIRAFHRMEMTHQDLRPENIMIDRDGTVKIIDFGSTRVAGVTEAGESGDLAVRGTLQYTAPEYFVYGDGDNRADIFSLGVLAYQMLTGRLPYDDQVPRLRGPGQLRKLRYRSATDIRPDLPAWVDGALRMAVHPDADRRYQALSQFEHDLTVPNPAFSRSGAMPLAERNPLIFWQGLSACLALALAILLVRGGF